MKVVFKASKGTIKFSLVSIALTLLAIGLGSVSFVFASTSSETYTQSNVTVNTAVAIAKSTNLTTEGIYFASGDPGTNGINATSNYNETSFMTQSWIHVDSTTNTRLVLCIKEDADLGIADGSYNISNTNYHYSFNHTAGNMTDQGADSPLIPATTDITNAYVNISSTDPASGLNATNDTMYFRFNLNIPSGQAAGTYENNVFFKGVVLSATC